MAYNLIGFERKKIHDNFNKYIIKDWKQPFELAINFMGYNKHCLSIKYAASFDNFYLLYSNFFQINLKNIVKSHMAIIYFTPYVNPDGYGLSLSSKSIMEETNLHVNTEGHVITNYPIFKLFVSGKSLISLLKTLRRGK